MFDSRGRVVFRQTLGLYISTLPLYIHVREFLASCPCSNCYPPISERPVRDRGRSCLPPSVWWIECRLEGVVGSPGPAPPRLDSSLDINDKHGRGQNRRWESRKERSPRVPVKSRVLSKRFSACPPLLEASLTSEVGRIGNCNAAQHLHGKHLKELPVRFRRVAWTLHRQMSRDLNDFHQKTNGFVRNTLLKAM